MTHASRRLRSSECLIVKSSPALLKMELDRWFWKDQDHVSIKKVWDALCAYCYLPRLRNQAVFIDMIQEGLKSGDYFAYATSVSEGGRYEGLKLAMPAAAIYVDAASVLVKPEQAGAQLEAEQGGREREEEGERRVQEGVARDDDIYVSQFALNRPGTGMTRRFGLAEGLEWEDLQRVNQGMELLAPLAPDRGGDPAVGAEVVGSGEAVSGS